MSASRLAAAPPVSRALFPSFPRRVLAPGPAEGPCADAAEEAATARQRAQREGFEAGQREGRAAAHAETGARLAVLAGALEAAAAGLVARRRELGEALEREAPRIVLLLAEKVLGREAMAAEIVTGVIGHVAARLTPATGPAVVRLAPETAAAFRDWLAASPEAPRLGAVSVESDQALAAQDWLLATAGGLMDGRIASQVEEAWRVAGEERG